MIKRTLLITALLPTLAYSGSIEHKITISAYMPKQAKIENVSIVNNQVVVELSGNASAGEIVFTVKREADSTVSIQF